MDGSKVFHRAARIASLALLTVIILQVFVINRAFGADGPALETDRSSYPIGGTVMFSGSGYAIGDPTNPNTYGINVSYDGVLVASLDSFTPTDTGDIPTGVSWAIPFDAKDGDYSAEAYTLPWPGTGVATVTFTVLSKAESLGVLAENLTDFITDVEATEISDSLLASLDNAIKKVESAIALFEADSSSKTAANQLRAARNMLTALVHKVLAQTGKSIDEDVAAELTEKALEYIRYIDSLIGATLEPLGKKLALNVEKALAKQEMHMIRFMIRKGLNEATTDEELLSLLDSMEEELTGNLERAKGKMKLLQELLDSGVITESDYESLLMELEKGGNSVNLVKAMADLLSEELEGLEQTKPGLGEHLGQLKKAIKGLVDESVATGESHGELTSEAHSQAEQHGQGNSGNGKGKDKDKDNNGKGKGKDK